jgi:hypothetical protein
VTSDEELEQASHGITNGPTLLRMANEIRNLRKLTIKLEIERTEALDLSSCKLCPSGFCSAHQPFTGKIEALKEALEDAKHTLLNIYRGNSKAVEFAGYVLKSRQADNCLGRIEAILQREKKG